MGRQDRGKLLLKFKKPLNVKIILLMGFLLVFASFITRSRKIIGYLFFDEEVSRYFMDTYHWEFWGLIIHIIGLTLLIYFLIRFSFPNWIVQLYNDRILITLRLQGKGNTPYNYITGLPMRISPLKLRFKKQTLILKDIIEIYTGTYPSTKKSFLGFFILKKNDDLWYYFILDKSNEYNQLLDKLKSLFGKDWESIYSKKY